MEIECINDKNLEDVSGGLTYEKSTAKDIR